MTFHEDAVRRCVEQALATDAAAGMVYMGYLQKMRRGDYGAMMDVVFQVSNRYPHLDILDAYAFAQTWAALGDGAVIHACLPVEGIAAPDHCVEKNSAVLATLPKPFAGTFYPARGRGARDDGTVRWSRPIVAWRNDQPGVPWLVRPGSVPLEVGTTKASRTWMHIQQDAGIARFPYDTSRVTLLIRREPHDGPSVCNRLKCEPWPKGVVLPNMSLVPSPLTKDLSPDPFFAEMEQSLRESLVWVSAAAQEEKKKSR